jgi:hypothetical protein
MPARVAKAAKDAKQGRKMTQRVAAKVKKADQQLEEALRKLNGINNKTPGRTSKKSGIDVGKDRVKKGSKAKVQKGAIYGTAGTGAVGAGVSTTKKKAPAKKTTTKKLPLYKKDGGPIHMEGAGRGVKYYQNGKQVRIK